MKNNFEKYDKYSVGKLVDYISDIVFFLGVKPSHDVIERNMDVIKKMYNQNKEPEYTAQIIFQELK